MNPSDTIRKIESLLLSGHQIKAMCDVVGLSNSSVHKYAQDIIRNAGYKTREQFMAAEIDRLRKLLKER